jgi:cytochrome c oxidase cbb3-type subunit I/II
MSRIYKKGEMKMKKRRLLKAWLNSAVLLLSAFLVTSAFPGDGTARAADVDGQAVYGMHCIGCHGDKGDGKGIVAEDFVVKPRDFTLGKFKFCTTERNSLPTDADLKNTITNGLATSAMPNYRLLDDASKDAVIGYIKTLSARWSTEQVQRKYEQAGTPDFVGTPDSIGKGEKLFAARCLMCHGNKKGQPDVIFSLRWQDGVECNDVIRPAVFSAGTIKRGPKVEDIRMSITAGVGWTPMLAWSELLSEQDRWHLTSYILDDMGKLGGEK